MTNHSRGLLLLWATACAAAVLTVPLLRAQTVRQESAESKPLVDSVSQAVTTFLGELSNVECTEAVSQTRLKEHGKIEFAENSIYDYLVLAESNGGELSLAESRLAKQEPRKTTRLPLMVTNGFSTLLLIFHPEYRSGFEFKQLEDEEADGTAYARLAFRHIPGMRSTAALMVRGREYPLDLQGVVWIDKGTGEIRKISAGLESPMEDIGLRAMHTEVVYAPVKFQETSNIYWLPQTATIDVESLHEHWRNVHHFTDYRQFSTSAKEKGSRKP
ncbi:MAG TPA: hypothetical protein VNM47_15300 [Terriglobia bacterium]|nr:hypothetical protein [Terriglobia bacterium]